MVFELAKDGFVLSTDPARLDLEAVYAFFSQTYWARNRPREVFEIAVRNSLCFGLYHQGAQIGFARAITDRATFGYLADVYVLADYRRRGLGHWLIESVLDMIGRLAERGMLVFVAAPPLTNISSGWRCAMAASGIAFPRILASTTC